MALQTLEEIQEQKSQLRASLEAKGEEIGALWTDLSTPKKANSKGELIASIISNGVTAFDAFMLVRKLIDRYGSLFGRRKKRKRR